MLYSLVLYASIFLGKVGFFTDNYLRVAPLVLTATVELTDQSRYGAPYETSQTITPYARLTGQSISLNVYTNQLNLFFT